MNILDRYEQVDPTIVIGILRNNLGDFEKFKKEIIDYLKAAEGP